MANELRSGLRHLTTITERIDRLTDRDFTGSEDHQELLWTVDWKQHHPFLQEFAAKAVLEGIRKNIPLYCADARSWSVAGSGGGCVSILHCQYGFELHFEDWQIIAHMLHEISPAHRFTAWRGKRKVVWEGGFSGANDLSRWVLSGFDEFVGERR